MPRCCRYHGVMLTLDTIRARLAQHAPPAIPTDTTSRRAAVAVILRAPHNAAAPPEVLFIKRGEHDGDPWSGHMAFPGGHADETDPSLMATAIRETWEEIGLDLNTHGQLIGRIEHEQAAPPSRPAGMLVAPFVFAITSTPKLVLSSEVAEVVWAPLQRIVVAADHTRQQRYGRGALGNFPGYLVGNGHFVWGLTYRMVHTFLRAVEPAWQPPE